MFSERSSLTHMRTLRGVCGTGSVGVLLVGAFIGVVAACSSDDPAATPAPVPEGGVGPSESGAQEDAADGATAAPGVPKRGTRIAHEFRETADGLSDLVGSVDTGLGNVRCFSARAEDGVTRCLPLEAPYLSQKGGVYADSSCGTELAAVTAGCTKPSFAIRVGEGTGCDARSAVFDVGAQHTAPIYEKQDASTCVPIASDAKQAYYVVGAKRAAADFVKLTSRIEPIAGGVGVTMNDGEDGSTTPQYQLIDVARAHACHDGTTVDSKTRCVPAASATVGPQLFTENTCTKPAVLVQPQNCDPLTKAIVAMAGTPEDDGRQVIFEIGAKVSANVTWRKIDTTCDGPAGGSDDVYERGPEIPPASFPELGLTTAGGSRIVAKRWSAAGVTLPPTASFHDVMLDLRCAMQTAADGKERCLPQGATVFFSDDQCTVPVTFSQATSPVPKYAVAFGSGCPRPFRVHPVGAAIVPAPAKIYDNFTGACVETAGGGGSSATYYALGAEVAPTTFAEITRAIR